MKSAGRPLVDQRPPHCLMDIISVPMVSQC